VSEREPSIRPACAALALVVALLGGCERAAPPSAGSAAPPPVATSPHAPAESGNAAEPAAPSAAFDVGEIKSAAEYLQEAAFTNADVRRGQLLSLACAACHSLGAGEPTIVGPNLHGMFGRRAAAVVGFDYSPALRDSGLVWTPRALEAWLADPASFVAGTKMTFTGYRAAEDRRDLIAYLLHATQ